MDRYVQLFRRLQEDTTRSINDRINVDSRIKPLRVASVKALRALLSTSCALLC